MGKSKTVETVRRGGKWEAVGFILIIIGLFFMFSSSPAAGSLILIGGFLVFLVGRFM